MDLTLSQLECFVSALDAGSFTAAADVLGVSQPAVAEQVQRLEQMVGQSLFARQARGVRPTRAGLDLEPHARRVLEAARAAVDAATHADAIGEGPVAFGTFGSPHHYGLTDLIRAFAEQHPGSKLRIVGRNSSSTADDVRSGVLDAAVVALPIDDSGLDLHPLFVGEVFYVSANPRRTRRPVTIETLAERPFILYESSAGIADPTRLQLASRAQAAGVHLEARIEVESADTALELAALGLGDTYAPQILLGSLDPSLTAVSFDPPLVDAFALISRAGSRLSRPVQDFVDRVNAHLLARIEASGIPRDLAGAREARDRLTR